MERPQIFLELLEIEWMTGKYAPVHRRPPIVFAVHFANGRLVRGHFLHGFRRSARKTINRNYLQLAHLRFDKPSSATTSSANRSESSGESDLRKGPLCIIAR